LLRQYLLEELSVEMQFQPENLTAETYSPVDSELVAAVLRKDRKATAEFVGRFGDAVYRYLHARLFPSPDRLDDLFQETFLAAWKHLPNFRGESALQTWLLGIARHKVEDYYRSRLRQAEPFNEQSQNSPVREDEEGFLNTGLDDAKRNQKITEVLAMLPEPYAMALIWRYWEKRSAREMAELSGKTEKAVERLLARARALFRERWHSERNEQRPGIL
jgi:RNA polymerase sigma-70 factor (ECF subfamily)